MADQLSETSTTTNDHGNNWPNTKLPADSDVPDDVSNGQETHSFADILSTAFTATGPVPSPPADTESNMQLGKYNFVKLIILHNSSTKKKVFDYSFLKLTNKPIRINYVVLLQL